MSEALDLDLAFPPATDGTIAVINQASTRQSAWNRFRRTPERPGLAEYIIEQEGVALEFLSDFDALDRLESLAEQLASTEGESARTALIQAQVASTTHRFADARRYLTQARSRGASAETINRLLLGIDQACGTQLEAVLEARRRIASETWTLEDLVPLGALLADLRKFDEADEVYRSALRAYRDVSPFAVAWVCFHLGVLWGELAPEHQLARAAPWYQKAIAYLPSYVKARVHLAEIHLSCGRPSDAEALLTPALSSGDPELRWRLGDVLMALDETAKAAEQLHAARLGFEHLLGKHPLAFADHAAEFYAGSGNDVRRAYELASVNVVNRPTLRAFEQAHAAALEAEETEAAAELLAAAARHWQATTAFRKSPLAGTTRTEVAHEN